MMIGSIARATSRRFTTIRWVTPFAITCRSLG
jgi:hypothetical protein